MIYEYIYEYSPGEFIVAEHGPRGAILRSVPPQVFDDMHVMPIQEGLTSAGTSFMEAMPADQHARRRELLLASTIPDFVKQMLIEPEFEWVNNVFVRPHDGSFDPRGSGYSILIR